MYSLAGLSGGHRFVPSGAMEASWRMQRSSGSWKFCPDCHGETTADGASSPPAAPHREGSLVLLWSTATELRNKHHNLEMNPLSGIGKAPHQIFRETDSLSHFPPATVIKTTKDLCFMKDKKNVPVSGEKKQPTQTINNIHKRCFLPQPGDVQLLLAQPKHKNFVQNHPEGSPSKTINPHVVALGGFPRTKSPKIVNISLLPSSLKIIESGSHCPLLIFEGEKSNGRNPQQLPHSTAQLPGFPSTFPISSTYYVLKP